MLLERYYCFVVYLDRYEVFEMEYIVVFFEVLIVLKIKWDFFCLLFEYYDWYLGLLCDVFVLYMNFDFFYIWVIWCEFVKGEIINSYLF